ncbi:MAG TPA: mechanosensitive ion channel family protein [Fibrobacteria bacterium]|jgi:small-conductance mechanosensitive channel|nr:mechanosensitive ion channel family protein [Fibrobacteria bacterium]
MNPLVRFLDSVPALQAHFLGNPLRAWLLFVITAAGGMLAVWIFDKTVVRAFKKLARRTESTLDDFFFDTAEKFFLPALYVLAVWLGLKHLALAPGPVKFLRAMVVILVAVQAVRFLSGFARQLLERQMLRRAESPEAAELEMRSVRGILVFVNIVGWIMASILVMDNLGIKVSTFVAGLGIGGIAIALAAQAVLGDLFSYFVIFFDRPFQVGHSIKVGSFQGEVESIGIKTTRLRSITGEMVVMSNKFLTDNQVQNFRMLRRRRALVTFDVDYATTGEQLRAIPGIVGQIVASLPLASLERAHLRSFEESGLRFEVVFHVEATEYVTFMDHLHEFNLRLKDALESRGIGFAFPTRVMKTIPAA